MTSPPSAQEKQYHRPRAGVTLNDGVFSSWNGHSPLSEPPPALRSCRYSPITSAMGDCSRTSAMSSSRIRPATRTPRSSAPVAASLVAGAHTSRPAARTARGGSPGACYRRRVRGLLVLWDIDFTLIDAGGVGTRLYRMVFREMFGAELPGAADMAGRTDRAIVLDTLPRAAPAPGPVPGQAGRAGAHRPRADRPVQPGAARRSGGAGRAGRFRALPRRYPPGRRREKRLIPRHVRQRQARPRCREPGPAGVRGAVGAHRERPADGRDEAERPRPGRPS